VKHRLAKHHTWRQLIPRRRRLPEDGSTPQKKGGPPTAGSVLSGSGALVASRYVVALLGWAGTVVIARELSPSAWGGFSFIFSVLGIVGFFTDLQISRIVLKSVIASGDAAERTVSSYITMRLSLGLAVYVACVAGVAVANYPPEIVQGTAVAGVTLLFASGWAALRIYFEATLWLRPVAIAFVVGQVAQLLSTLAIAVSGRGTLISYTLPAVLFDLTVFAIVLAVARRVIRIRPAVDLAAWWQWTREALPLALGSSLAVVYYRVDMVMLSKLDTLDSVGFYSIAYKFSDLVGYLPQALLAPTLTLLVRAWPKDSVAFRRVFRYSFVLLLILAVGISVAFAGVAQDLIILFYGSRYGVVDEAAVRLVASQALNFFSQLSFVTLVAANRERTFPIAYLVGLIINVALNFLLIPRYSYNGAAMATLVTEFFVLLILAIPVLRLPQVRPLPVGATLRVMFAGMLAGIPFLALGGGAPWLLVAVMAGVVYLGAVHLLRPDGPGGVLAVIRNAPRVPEEDDRPSREHTA
jgi:O-antigen/teichoic acid export membrane protein